MRIGSEGSEAGDELIDVDTEQQLKQDRVRCQSRHISLLYQYIQLCF